MRNLPGALDSCGQCSFPQDADQTCRCTMEKEAMGSCIPCNINSTAINTGLRLCVPNDASVTMEPGPYSVFDIEVDLVYEAFTTIANVTYPGHLDVDGNLLDCFCVPQACPCCCKESGTMLDVCGLCTGPDATPGGACNCTADNVDSGLCIQCPLGSSASSDSVRLCHPIIAGVYELIDVNICAVRDQFSRFPGSVYPGYFGVNAQGGPLALDCFCQPPVTTTTTTAATTSGTTSASTTIAATNTTVASTTSTLATTLLTTSRTTATTTATIPSTSTTTSTTTTTATTTTASTTTTVAPTTRPPVLPFPPNQVPPVLDRPPFGPNGLVVQGGTTSARDTTTRGPTSSPSSTSNSIIAGTTSIGVDESFTATTTPQPEVARGQPTTEEIEESQTDLLAIIAVPSAVLAATIAFLAVQIQKEASPRFYPQSF